jgi:hypothetical protein
LLHPQKLYCILPSVIEGGRVISILKQLLITNEINAVEIYNYLNFRIELNSFKYDF